MKSGERLARAPARFNLPRLPPHLLSPTSTGREQASAVRITRFEAAALSETSALTFYNDKIAFPTGQNVTKSWHKLT